jgi:hypothetical protein
VARPWVGGRGAAGRGCTRVPFFANHLGNERCQESFRLEELDWTGGTQLAPGLRDLLGQQAGAGPRAALAAAAPRGGGGGFGRSEGRSKLHWRARPEA